MSASLTIQGLLGITDIFEIVIYSLGQGISIAFMLDVFIPHYAPCRVNELVFNQGLSCGGWFDVVVECKAASNQNSMYYLKRVYLGSLNSNYLSINDILVPTNVLPVVQWTCSRCETENVTTVPICKSCMRHRRKFLFEMLSLIPVLGLPFSIASAVLCTGENRIISLINKELASFIKPFFEICLVITDIVTLGLLTNSVTKLLTKGLRSGIKYTTKFVLECCAKAAFDSSFNEGAKFITKLICRFSNSIKVKDFFKKMVMSCYIRKISIENPISLMDSFIIRLKMKESFDLMKNISIFVESVLHNIPVTEVEFVTNYRAILDDVNYQLEHHPHWSDLTRSQLELSKDCLKEFIFERIQLCAYDAVVDKQKDDMVVTNMPMVMARSIQDIAICPELFVTCDEVTKQLLRLSDVQTPTAMMECFNNSYIAVETYLSNRGEVGADNVLPVLEFAIAQSNAPKLWSSAQFVSTFCNSDLLIFGKEACYFTHMQAMIEHIRVYEIN
eukprot:gene9097-12268_t